MSLMINGKIDDTVFILLQFLNGGNQKAQFIFKILIGTKFYSKMTFIIKHRICYGRHVDITDILHHLTALNAVQDCGKILDLLRISVFGFDLLSHFGSLQGQSIDPDQVLCLLGVYLFQTFTVTVNTPLGVA